MAKVIGNYLYLLKRITLKKYGQEDFNNILFMLSTESKNVFSQIIISQEFYDFNVHKEFSEAVVKLKGREALLEINKELARKQLGGIFGFFLKYVNLDMVLGRAKKMWKQIYDSGELEIINDKDFLRIIIKDFVLSDAQFLGKAGYFLSLGEVLLKKEYKYSYKKVSETEFEFVFNYV